jgi:phosphopantetheinyl transferase
VTSLDVRVFSVDLDQPADVVERLDGLLPEAERDAPPPIRIARAAARLVLADALGVEPIAVGISRECMHCGDPAHGRPRVTGDRSISFSLSHSDAFAVVALADGDVRVGIDCEVVKARTRIDELAARVLSDEAHAAWLSIADADERLRSFLRTWTAKEAYLKALGIGITTALRDVPSAVEGWCIRPLDVGEACVGTIAVDHRDIEIRASVLALRAS